MWSRLEWTMHSRKGVTAFWRVAAIFLGLLFAAGVFAGLNNRAIQKKEIASLQNQNTRLQNTVDSLLARPTKIQTETKIVEKIIYRYHPVLQSEVGNHQEWREKFRQFSDSTKKALSCRETLYKKEMQQIQTELARLEAELSSYKQNTGNQSKDKGGEPFQLKGERIEPGIQKSNPVKSPEVELKLFRKNFLENTNNLNSTLLKNKP